jgi:hypothetical protein
MQWAFDLARDERPDEQSEAPLRRECVTLPHSCRSLKAARGRTWISSR